MSLDRLADGYVEPRFDIDAEFGHQGELFAANVAQGITVGAVEVKSDAMFARTGRLYIERECKGRPSGIAVSDSKWWAWSLANHRMLIVVPTDVVRKLSLGRLNEAACLRGSHPTVGYVLPIGTPDPLGTGGREAMTTPFDKDDRLDRVHYHEDPMAPSRGCFTGLLLAALLWSPFIYFLLKACKG